MEEKAFVEKLVQAIKECGGWVVEHADDIAGKADGRSGLVITINMGLDMSTEAPTITISREHIPLKAFEALHNV